MNEHYIKSIADQLVFNFMGSKIQSLSEELADINWDNQTLYRYNADGFTYIGKVYLITKKPDRTIVKLPLHVAFHERMQKYLVMKTKLDGEINKIHQCLRGILKSCWTVHDIRDNLPDHLVEKINFTDPVPPRTREPGYAIKGNVLAEKMYERLLFILDFHSIQKLFI